MRYMVLGFAIDERTKQVLLIRKNRPEWQAGKLNGIGGHLEACDRNSSRDAMVREFKEETGIATPDFIWELRGRMQHLAAHPGEDSWSVSVYTCSMADWQLPVKTTDEEPLWVGIDELDALAITGVCLDNIPVLVALCMLPASKPSNRVPRFLMEY
jgi:8-oxo-dGTP diphosphatase